MTIVRHDIELENWPLLPTKETNRQRIIRALKEADGVVPQCSGMTHDGEMRCALGIVGDVLDQPKETYDLHEFGLEEKDCGFETIDWMNDSDGLSFAQIATVLEQIDGYWNEHADEEFRG